MKSMLRYIDDHGIKYKALMFVCPGCVIEKHGGSGLHMLSVNNNVKQPSWEWNGKFFKPTLNPSILTKTGPNGIYVCHSFLKEGVFEFLDDCTHSLAGQKVEIPDLPDWVTREKHEG